MKKFKLIEFWKMKFFFDAPSLLEWRSAIDAPGFLTDDLFVAAIAAKKVVRNEKVLLHRLQILQRLLGRKEWSRNLYFTVSGVVKYTLQEVRLTIRPADKYSGYVRNSSAVGSKRSQRKASLEPETTEWQSVEKIDFLEFLTVGEFTTGIQPGSIFFTLMKDQKSETVTK